MASCCQTPIARSVSYSTHGEIHVVNFTHGLLYVNIFFYILNPFTGLNNFFENYKKTTVFIEAKGLNSKTGKMMSKPAKEGFVL